MALRRERQLADQEKEKSMGDKGGKKDKEKSQKQKKSAQDKKKKDKK